MADAPNNATPETREEMWTRAGKVWLQNLRLRAPTFLESAEAAEAQQASGVLACISALTFTTLLNLHYMRERGVDQYLYTFMAHEIGHHAIAPAGFTNQIRDEIAPRGAKSSHRVSSPMLRVHDGEAVDARGERWLSGRYSSERWALVYLVEPFGTKSWDGVSQVGISDGRLLAYSKPLGLIATLSPPGFEVAIQRGEPSGYIWPEKRRCELSGVGEVFRASTDLWCGLTRDGAVAFLRESR